MSTAVVVVGNGMAGARLATQVRGRIPGAKITILGAEPHAAYNRILLTRLLAGTVSESDVELADATAHGVDVRRGTTVTAIDRDARLVVTADGDAIAYDSLVLATGSTAVVPPLEGLDRTAPLPRRVAALRTLDDCRRIVESAATGGHAIVLGGGLLGLEAARALAHRGLAVTVVHGAGHLMERQLNPAAAAVLGRTLAALGVRTVIGAAAMAVRAGAGGVTLELAGRECIDADLLLLSCGVAPAADLARAAGLEVQRGVVVDERLRTSDPDIFAIGDCAQPAGGSPGLLAPAWEQARVVAAVLAGDPATYRPLATVARLKADGVDLAAMGDAVTPAGDGVEELTFSDPLRGTYALLRIRDERVVGAILLGDNPSVGTVVQLYDRGSPVPADRRALLLGRSYGTPAQPTALSPALMPDAAVVCQCNAVSKGALVSCWRSGARSTADVVAATRATTGCGTCRDAVDGIVAWLSTVDPPEESA